MICRIVERVVELCRQLSGEDDYVLSRVLSLLLVGKRPLGAAGTFILGFTTLPIFTCTYIIHRKPINMGNYMAGK